MKFREFPKLSRLSREIIITEKIDGTNASVFIQPEVLEEFESDYNTEIIAKKDGFTLRAGSRTRWITPANDNFGFANWVKTNSDQIFQLGEGHHFGEWWGSGIQRGYNLPKGEKRFSLFNTIRWNEENTPACINIVPVLYVGLFNTDLCETAIKELTEHGSLASPGFMNPEGIVAFHTAGNIGFKKTIKDDGVPKSTLK